MIDDDLSFSRKGLEPLTLNFDPELIEFFRYLADKQGLPTSVFVRKLAMTGLNVEISTANSWKLFKSAMKEEQNF